VQSGGTEHAIVQIVPAEPAIRLSHALFNHGGWAPSGLQIGGSVQSISIALGSGTRNGICSNLRCRACGPLVRSGDLGDGSIKGRCRRVEARYETHAKLLLAFLASIGFKPGDFMTIGMNEKRAA